MTFTFESLLWFHIHWQERSINFSYILGFNFRIFGVHHNSVPVCSCPDPTFCWMRSWWWNKSSPSLGKQLFFHNAKYCFWTTLDSTSVLRHWSFTSLNIVEVQEWWPWQCREMAHLRMKLLSSYYLTWLIPFLEVDSLVIVSILLCSGEQL